MSTSAPAPLPGRRLHLPSHRHLDQLGPIAGAAAGAVAYLAAENVAIAFFVFVLVWYTVAYALPRVVEHEPRRDEWLVHVALLPAGSIAAALAISLAWQDHVVTAVLLGLLAGAVLQALVTQTLLRGVVDDQRHDLRRRLGLE